MKTPALTTPKDIAENEHERRWAQSLNDSDDRPSWFPDLVRSVVEDEGSAELLELAIDIIDTFPPRANNDQVDIAIQSRANEECLHPQKMLEEWLFADSYRLVALDEALGMEPPVQSLLEALRRAWSVHLRDVIATVRVFLCEQEPPNM